MQLCVGKPGEAMPGKGTRIDVLSSQELLYSSDGSAALDHRSYSPANFYQACYRHEVSNGAVVHCTRSGHDCESVRFSSKTSLNTLDYICLITHLNCRQPVNMDRGCFGHCANGTNFGECAANNRQFSQNSDEPRFWQVLSSTE